MNETEIRDAVRRALATVAPEVDLDTLDPAADFSEDLDLDSMDTLNLMVVIHERTGIEVPERDYPQLASLEGCVAYLTARVGST